MSSTLSSTSRQPLRWLAFAAAIAAAAMDLLDSTIAQVAAPAVRRDLNRGSNRVSTVETAKAGS